jgi:hypothetical protein
MTMEREKASWPGATEESDPDVDDGRDAHPRNSPDPVGDRIFAIDRHERFDAKHAAEISLELSYGPDFLQGPFRP